MHEAVDGDGEDIMDVVVDVVVVIMAPPPPLGANLCVRRVSGSFIHSLCFMLPTSQSTKCPLHPQ